MNWIDRQTRAVFVEFSVYNPNTNLIMVSTILVEFLSSGSILATARFDPLNLFNEVGLVSFRIISELILACFVIYFTVLQFKELLTKGILDYLNDFWSYIEWAIAISAWISLVMFFLRYKAANEVLTFFKNTAGFGYTKLQKVNDYNQTLTYSLGLCASLSTIKFLKLLRFNRNIAFLGLTFKNCFGELTSYSVMFFVVWFSFVQLMFLIYNCNLSGYASIIKSMETTFQIMLGKFDVSDMNQTQPILGPLIFSVYNIVIIFFALNIFISIITDSFDEIRRQEDEDTDLFELIQNKLHTVFRKEPENSPEKLNSSYIEFKSFPQVVERLNNYIARVIYFPLFKRSYIFTNKLYFIYRI